MRVKTKPTYPISFIPRESYREILDSICALHWRTLTHDDLINVASVYYYFSVQFRETLEIALNRYPDDERLLELDRGERDTDNLSPWPGVALTGERMNHDEFMRRTIGQCELPETRRHRLEIIGQSYLATIHSLDHASRISGLTSYEDGGLERVFRAILTARSWSGPVLAAFRHFLLEHIKFDSDPEHGHGALCRHLVPNDSILPLWTAFRRMLVEAAPALTGAEVTR